MLVAQFRLPAPLSSLGIIVPPWDNQTRTYRGTSREGQDFRFGQEVEAKHFEDMARAGTTSLETGNRGRARARSPPPSIHAGRGSIPTRFNGRWSLTNDRHGQDFLIDVHPPLVS